MVALTVLSLLLGKSPDPGFAPNQFPTPQVVDAGTPRTGPRLPPSSR